MSIIISGDTLKARIRNSELIEFGREQNCKGLKYDLVFSGRYLKAKLRSPVEYKEIPVAERKDNAVVKPGEVIFIITEEIFNLPQNYYAQLTPKRNMAELGINVNGALFVDPGYHGKLVFGLYNFSSEDFALQPGKTFAAAVIYELEDQEIFEYDSGKQPKPIMDFSPELINTIAKCEPVGFTELARVLQDTIRDIGVLRQQVDTTELWKKNVQQLIDNISQENSRATHNITGLQQSIETLRKSIEAETTARKDAITSETTDRKDAITAETAARKDAVACVDKKVDKKMITLQTLGYIITTIIIGGGGTLLIGYLTGLIKFQ